MDKKNKNTGSLKFKGHNAHPVKVTTLVVHSEIYSKLYSVTNGLRITTSKIKWHSVTNGLRVTTSKIPLGFTIFASF